ncbi:MAG: GDSL-type esterase/lipase family protein [Thermoguttaceae bacterium]|jgi:lysophospholipase L1-like esterase
MKDPANQPKISPIPSRKIRWAWKTYLVLIHVVLIVGLFRHDLVQRVEQIFLGTPAVFDDYRGMVEAQKAQAKCMSDNCIIFLGNSITYGLDMKAVTNGNVMNFGINSDNTEGMLWRIAQYPNLKSAKAIVLSIGINDLSRFDDNKIISNYNKILNSLPEVPVIVSCLLPINEHLCTRANISYLTGNKATNARIKSINRELKDLCRHFPNVTLIDAFELMSDETGNLRPEYTTDGVHLTALGYDAWIRFLKARLAEKVDR